MCIGQSIGDIQDNVPHIPMIDLSASTTVRGDVLVQVSETEFRLHEHFL
jgi:hypothetical protein